MSAAFFELIKSCVTSTYLRANNLDASRERVNLNEKVEYPDGRRVKRTVRLFFEGEAFTVKLDYTNSGSCPPLYHFLREDQPKPWAKRCDFIVFHRLPSAIYCYLFEFKSDAPDIVGAARQLEAGLAWLKSLHRILHHYTDETFPIVAQKFLLTSKREPDAIVDETGKYLIHDTTIRHYHYQELEGMDLADLENRNAVELTCQ